VHSAVEWTLRRLGYGDQIQKEINKLAELGQRPNFQWYVTKSGITMIIIEAPGQVTLGSPVTELERDSRDEHQWTCNVDWSFAVSATEITQAQYQAEFPEYPEYQNDYAPSDLCPANAISWLDAVQFCRQLSERDGFSAAEMAVPSIEKLKKGPYPDFRTRQGYRLPIEAEWEIACRAGSVTPRFFGHDPDLLDAYSWYRGNSSGPMSDVGRKMPNGFGFFDMLGNVSELCFDIYLVHTESNDSFQAPGFKPFGRYAARGNNIGSLARMTRSANRRFVDTKETSYVRGFRIARTVKTEISKP
jgi:formylglycine-generating enzyme required for sulfatase activity